jgi:hypothetical protein
MVVVVQETGYLTGYRVGCGLVAVVVSWQRCYGHRVVSGGVSRGGQISDSVALLW